VKQKAWTGREPLLAFHQPGERAANPIGWSGWHLASSSQSSRCLGCNCPCSVCATKFGTKRSPRSLVCVTFNPGPVLAPFAVVAPCEVRDLASRRALAVEWVSTFGRSRWTPHPDSKTEPRVIREVVSSPSQWNR
jgi:hypothetical protein